MSAHTYRLGPAYDFSNKSVQLHQGQAEMRIGENCYTGDGEVRLDFLPQAKINIYGRFWDVPSDDALQASIGQKDISSFSINGKQISGFNASSRGSSDSQEFDIKWCPKSEPILGVGDKSTQMAWVVFHLFNFDDILGTRRSMEQTERGFHAIDYFDLIYNEWKIELKSLVSTSENVKHLRAEGGYRLTQIGSIRKIDEATFTGEDAKECLEGIRHFFSFAKGDWCNPICAVGYDGSRNRVWESWSSPQLWRKPLSWFDTHSGNQLTALFPLFMQRWANDDWREALHEVIYWYLTDFNPYSLQNLVHSADSRLLLWIHEAATNQSPRISSGYRR